MRSEQDYLDMQRRSYNDEGRDWTWANRNRVVGNYDAHNAWPDYDIYLFKDIETKGLKALEYGCGPGRNIIRYKDRFERVDGTDISFEVVNRATTHLKNMEIDTTISLCDGKSLPFADESYDVVFSTICLQHIACHSVRFSIMKDAYRVLRPNGYLCFQMGFGGKQDYKGADYYQNLFDANCTNGGCDVDVFSEDCFRSDLLDKIGFKHYSSDIRPVGPGDTHKEWIFVRVQK